MMKAREATVYPCFVAWCGELTARNKIRNSVQKDVPMKTQGEIEAAVCEGIARFQHDYMGRGPKAVHAYLIGDLLVVRLKGVLTVAEQQLVESLPADKGRDLLKQVRTHLVETARPTMEAMIQEATGVEVLSLHHDISTSTGEEVLLFTLITSPGYRETRKPGKEGSTSL
jgi:uncharacterized protein YbcI